MTKQQHGRAVFRLRDLMNERGFSVSDLARISGVSRPTIMNLRDNYNKGVQLDTLARLCCALKVSIGTLLVFQVDKPRGADEQNTRTATGVSGGSV